MHEHKVYDNCTYKLLASSVAPLSEVALSLLPCWGVVSLHQPRQPPVKAIMGESPFLSSTVSLIFQSKGNGSLGTLAAS